MTAKDSIRDLALDPLAPMKNELFSDLLAFSTDLPNQNGRELETRIHTH